MASDQLALHLDGNVSLAELADALESFNGLIEALSDDITPGASIKWTIVGLESGSATAKVRGEAAVGDDIDDVSRIVQAYGIVGRALESNAVIPYSPRVREQARKLTGVLRGNVTAIRFRAADDEEATIIEQMNIKEPKFVTSYGSIEGRVLTLASRRQLAFTLYDSVYDHGVTCYFQLGREDEVQRIWRKHVRVDGLVSRDIVSGQPESVHDIREIVPLEKEAVGGFELARGAVPRPKGAPDAVEAIRRVRDAW